VGSSLINKDLGKQMKLINDATGQIIEMDRARQRIRRCQKRVHTWANILDPYIKDETKNIMVMVTLTYANGEDWRPGHIKAFMAIARKQLGDKLIGYAWVAELQKREAVHYHVLLVMKKGVMLPKPDQAGWWVMGSTRIEKAKTPFYIVTYTGKEHQKNGHFPKGLRMFAIWISSKVTTELERWLLRLSAIPAWLKAKIFDTGVLGVNARRNYGGGWMFDGKLYKSPWRIMHFQ